MLKFLVLLSVIACALGAARQPQLDGRIVGGTIATIDQFPWQVSLLLDGYIRCGGSIYSESTIVTAAHCLKFSVNRWRIRAGSSFWDEGGVIRKVVSYKIHEKYDSKTVIYDIGVMRLETPLEFSSTIRPIPLASIEPLNGASALISGWGLTESDANSFSTVLQYINSTTISRKKCRDPSYGYGNGIHSTMICAAAPGKDACKYDSGGPMVSDGVLVGVISFGMGCANKNYPGVYANVAVLRNWVKEAAKTV